MFLYVLSAVCVFSILLSTRPRSDRLAGFAGLSRENLSLAASLSVVFLSAAGVPPFAGFLGKLLVLLSAVSSAYLLVPAVFLILSVLAAFFYVRVAQLAFFPSELSLPMQRALLSGGSVSLPRSLLIAACSFFLVFFLPSPGLLLQVSLQSAVGLF